MSRYLFLFVFLLFSYQSYSGTVPITGGLCGGFNTPVEVCNQYASPPSRYPGNFSGSSTIYFQCLRTDTGTNSGGGSCQGSYYNKCVAPNTWSNDYSTCNTPPSSVQCDPGKYDNAGTCTPVPDCNAGHFGGGYYFDYVSKGCAEGSHVICLGTVKTQYCPTNTDCQTPGTICSNDPTSVATAKAEKAANLQAALDRAKADVDRANKAVQDAQAPVATREMEKAQATTNVATSKAALDAAVSNPDATSAQKSAAAQAYADAINASIAASNRNDNTQISASQVLNDAQIAADHKNAIPTDPTSGHGDADATGAKDAADAAEDHLHDTIAGGGPGSGSGQGSGSGSGSGSGITPEGVAEGVKKGIKDALTPSDGVSLNPGGLGPGSGSGRGNGTPTDTDGDGECDVDCGQDTDGDGQCDLDCGTQPGSFEQAIQDGEDLMAESRGQLDDKMQEIRAGVSSIFGSAISNGAESLPVVDFGTMKGVPVMLDMNKYADQLSIISAIIMALAWLAALSIILGGK